LVLMLNCVCGRPTVTQPCERCRAVLDPLIAKEVRKVKLAALQELERLRESGVPSSVISDEQVNDKYLAIASERAQEVTLEYVNGIAAKRLGMTPAALDAKADQMILEFLAGMRGHAG
jgi:hypothetical protein